MAMALSMISVVSRMRTLKLLNAGKRWMLVMVRPSVGDCASVINVTVIEDGAGMVRGSVREAY